MIPPFPSHIAYGGSNGTAIILSAEQVEWLRACYPTELNTVLASMMGIHRCTLARLVRRLGLTKASDYFTKKKKTMSEKTKEIINSERRREYFGLSRHTKYHLPQKPYTKKELRRREKARLRGYLLSPDLMKDRYTIFYSSETVRRPKFEANSRAEGFKIQQWK